MDEKTLEEKLYSVLENVEDVLNKDEMTEYEYKDKMNDLLLREGVLDQRKGVDYNDPTAYIAERFVHLGGPFEFHMGLNNYYVSGKGKEIKSSEIKQDIINYKNVYERAKEYAGSIELDDITEEELVKDLNEYVKNQEEIKDVNEIRKNHVTREMVNGIRLNTGLFSFFMRKEQDYSNECSYEDILESFKKNEPTYDGFTHSQLDTALDKVNMLKKYEGYDKDKFEDASYKASDSKIINFLFNYLNLKKA
ncbi:MAG: hypothetical protein ACOCZQ_01010 [Nanoarchaeota archaeon]